MNRKCLNVIAILSLLAGTNSQAQTLDDVKAQLKSQPYMLEIPESNTTIFNQYCVGDATSANIPQPNYENPEVVSAAKKITETKTIANARLNNVQQKEFLQNLSYMKETVQQLISSSNEPVLVTAAQTFLAEISKADVTSISPEAAAAYKDMKKASLIKIKKAILGVAPKLETELNGVDVNKFKVLIDNLEKQINIELKAYDQTSAVGIIASFNSVIQKQIKPINISVIVKIAQQLLDIEVSAYGKELEADITIAQKTAKEFLSGNQNNSMPAGDMYYYLQNFDGALSEIINKTQDQVFTQMYASVKEESQKLDMTSLSTGMANLAQYSQIPTGDEYEQFKNEMEDVRYYLDDAIAKNVLVFSQEEQKSYNQFLQLNTSMSFYDALDLIKTIKASLAKNTDKENTSAYDTASSLSYTIPKNQVSQEIKKALAALETEITKLESTTTLTALHDAVNVLNKGDDISNDDIQTVFTLSYYLGQVSFAPETQTLVNSIKEEMKTVSNIVEVSQYMDTVSSSKQADHFYFYGGVRRLYRLGSQLPQNAVNAGANTEAHWFLTQLCGEFRDRATMIAAKVKWVNNMNILPKSKSPVIEPETLATAKNVWMRLNASAYYPFLNVSSQLWNARRSAQPRYITVGSDNNVDNPVPGLTVCETKYIFAKYVANSKNFDDVQKFDEGYHQFKKDCPKDDVSDYYDFRGDSNFKHYSPESNAMIWQATSLASACTSSTKAKDGSVYTDADCENYFKRPFFYRYNAARAGLATWLFRSDKYANTFSSQGSMVAIYPHKEPFNAPYAFGFDATSTSGALLDFNPEWLGVPYAWDSPDIGFNAFAGLGTNSPNYDRAYSLIRDAVDRHTDWYSSGYNDGNGGSRDQAYSPFVASSYVMQSSDSFTTCGITVQCPPDGLKRWMFVFRIKAKNWYTPQRVANNEPVDFDKMWFDETSFGVSGLADGEHAWDRLGTAMEDEMDSILYLVNVGDAYEDNN